MVHNSIGLSLAVVACSGLVIAAQAPPPAQQPAPQTPSAQTVRQSNTTIVGCVYEEKNVPGRSLNTPGRRLEDFIGNQPSAPPPHRVRPASGPRSWERWQARAAMTRAEAVVGKRVEVTGRIDREAGDSTARPAETPAPSQADKAIGRDKVDLAEFEIVSIKEVPGACPASAKAAP
jgi:hypothetical protein